ncbi:type II toxin-antitoxin system RelE/ParE family toxin [Rhizobium sp. C4]|uniref:type II toxin-antitoxin system RelE/ParE family toxin n=1 Tax=Rhizobium sp. C4 TaxID=1349800 RepID=UPI001E572510|nr:type II toxin-antitoxin system RelE/ParE family toxin [Rhizobium sp. C4]MCD2171538.1 type II toxin-antitoxin system RelE/ParE family toxin [Rhizobium sp. C4]
MIRSFKDKQTEKIFESANSRRLPAEISVRARRKLMSLHAANMLDDLRVPPSNRLERLKGDREGQYSIRINDQWRICFRFEDGDAFDVEICDYH